MMLTMGRGITSSADESTAKLRECDRNKGEGYVAKKSENFADVIYTCPLMVNQLF